MLSNSKGEGIVLNFIAASPLLAIFLSLGLGYLIGGIRFKSFSIGATIGTLIVAFVLSRFTSFEIPSILVSIFSVLFCFTIGYEAGPALFGSFKSSGLKYVLHAVFFCAASTGILWAIAACLHYSRDVAVGMAAGALTQTSILSVVENLGDDAPMTYALTYLTGTVLNVFFVSRIAPILMRTSAAEAVKAKLDKEKLKLPSNNKATSFSPVYLRAFVIETGTVLIGKSVGDVEAEYNDKLQVEKIFRGGEAIPFEQETVLQEQDVICVIGKMKYLIAFENQYDLTESAEEQHHQIELCSETIVVTKAYEGDLPAFLSDCGIVVQALFRNGKRLHRSDGNVIQKGDVVRVSGTERELKKVAREIGFIKDTGAATDVPFLFLAVALGVACGAIRIFGIPLGESTMALIIGLVVGWYYNKHPRFGRFPSSARWFLKSVGLNLFIAAKTLSTGALTFNKSTAAVIGIGAAVTILPMILTMIFGKFALRMTDADNLGSLCGSSTCTASLNALTDATGSSVFSASFATTNAVSNILLTVVGIIISLLIH